MVILCVRETLQEREAGRTTNVVEAQLQTTASVLNENGFKGTFTIRVLSIGHSINVRYPLCSLDLVSSIVLPHHGHSDTTIRREWVPCW